MSRVVLLLKNGMGDVLMALPLVRHCVARMQAKDQVLILVKSSAEEAIIKNEGFDSTRVRVRPVGEIWGKSRWETMQLALRLRKYHPDFLLLPHSTIGPKMSLFALLVRAGKTVTYSSALNTLMFGRGVPVAEDEHKVRRYLRFAEPAGLGQPSVIDTQVRVAREHRDAARRLFVDWAPSQTWIGLAPGSGPIELHKRWPVSRYVPLAKRLLERDPKYRIAVIGSPVERELVTEIVTEIHSDRAIAFVQPDIMLAAAALTFCSCLVSGCSGSSHLGAAVGTPLVSLFGPTNPHFTGPYSSRRRIVEAGIRCSPCYRLGFIKGCGNPICMSSIEASHVEREVLLALDGKYSSDVPVYSTSKARRSDARPRTSRATLARVA